MATPTDEEQALLDILSADDLLDAAEIDESEAGEDDIALDDDQRAALASILNSNMPSPKEIEQDAKNAAHNAENKKRREAKLARRRARQAEDARLGRNRRKNQKTRRR